MFQTPRLNRRYISSCTSNYRITCVSCKCTWMQRQADSTPRQVGLPICEYIYIDVTSLLFKTRRLVSFNRTDLYVSISTRTHISEIPIEELPLHTTPTTHHLNLNTACVNHNPHQWIPKYQTYKYKYKSK